MTDPRCPCGSNQSFATCCEPIISGVPAPTAVALMRSRYSAFARTAFGYLVATHDPDTRGDVSVAALARATRGTKWRGLEIVATEAGTAADDTGIVEFIARGEARGVAFSQRERSRFRRIDGRWHDVGGEIQRHR
jgi:SEC-C motif domain protein